MRVIPVLLVVSSVLLFGVLLRTWLRLPPAERALGRRVPWSAAQWRLWMMTFIALFLFILIGGALMYLELGP
jgi:hypothetical protein